ncbi:MAG: type II secretion system protein N [bacterium]
MAAGKPLSLITLLMIGLLSFIVSFAWQLPAALILPYAEAPLNARFTGISGTIWQGKIQQVQLKHKGKTLDLGQATWTFKPKRLLQAQLALDVQLQKAAPQVLHFDGTIFAEMDQTIGLDNTQFQVSIAQIKPFIPQVALLTGDVNGDIQQFTWQDKALPPQLRGTFQWQGGTTFPKVAVGQYRATIEPEQAESQQGLRGELDALAAPLNLTGSIRLDQQWQYNLSLTLGQNEQTDEALAHLLKMAGKTDTNGRISLKKQGNIQPYVPKFPTL